jgi:roadblock/LC7 domain-containing protein
MHAYYVTCFLYHHTTDMKKTIGQMMARLLAAIRAGQEMMAKMRASHEMMMAGMKAWQKVMKADRGAMERYPEKMETESVVVHEEVPKDEAVCSGA